MSRVPENLRGFLARAQLAMYPAGDDPVGREFQEIKDQAAAFRQDNSCSTDVGGSPENLKKNRYKDILPYDQTRVPVTLLADETGSDYINASFIKGTDNQPRYIATQGPLSHTVVDFWRMIWQYQVKVIVMACREVEQGKKKCERYWPLEEDPVQYGAFAVSTVTKVMVNPEVVFRNLKVTFQEEVREVGHFQYIAWPDRGIPDSYACFLEMIQLVRQHQGEHSGPMCVHCSAGCGRTGVICTVEYIQSLLQKQSVPSDFSIFDIVLEMRRQRPSAVQTKEQYNFLYHAVTEMFEKQLKNPQLYENLMQNKAPYYDDVQPLLTNPRTHAARKKELSSCVSLPPDYSNMSETYAVINKRPTAVASMESMSLPTTFSSRGPAYSAHQYDNVCLRAAPVPPADQLYSTVVPKPNRASTCVLMPSNSVPISSSYSLAGAQSPPEVHPNEYNQVFQVPSTAQSPDDYEYVNDATKGPVPAISGGIGFNCRIGKPKGPRDPPPEWSR
ncbi:tyrosine-protein phosphatase non-receptor type 18 [Pseudophryne corroboree]|uniref:tyrosine-protein phosphatase non-receptor type 18 n=1 Tax=Pseudophryne corroboree TaxID=495146 RepID=UPI003081C2DD